MALYFYPDKVTARITRLVTADMTAAGSGLSSHLPRGARSLWLKPEIWARDYIKQCLETLAFTIPHYET